MRAAAAIYKAQSEDGGDQPEADSSEGGSASSDDDIVDADFEDLDDNKRA